MLEQLRIQPVVVGPWLGCGPTPGAPDASAICSSFSKLTVCDGTVCRRDPLQAATLLPLLLPSWMDPEQLIKSFGPYALWGVAFVIFAECGLFAILPGDSLLFTVGC
jgi:hypothetical protein